MLIDFAKFSSVKIGGVFDVMVLDRDNAKDFDGFVIGGANNLLISPKPPKMGILSDEFNQIAIKNGILEIGAKTSAGKIYSFAKKNNIGGFEFLRHIPGTLGGLVSMNAGVKEYEISNNLISISTANGDLERKKCGFAYRKSEISGVILGARFKVNGKFDENLDKAIQEKRKNQPKGASFGSCFKNPANDSAGRFIQNVGLKGHRIGGCGFSDIHANFLINYGGGSFDEAIDLIKLAKKRVFENFGINLEEEVKII